MGVQETHGSPPEYAVFEYSISAWPYGAMTAPRDPRYDRLAAAIKAARLAAGLTQEEVAMRVRLTQSVIAKIERSQRCVDVIELVEIASAMRTNVSTLLELAEIGTPPPKSTKHGHRR